MAERKAVIKNADMSLELQEDAVDVAARVRSGTAAHIARLCFAAVQVGHTLISDQSRRLLKSLRLKKILQPS